MPATFSAAPEASLHLRGPVYGFNHHDRTREGSATHIDVREAHGDGREPGSERLNDIWFNLTPSAMLCISYYSLNSDGTKYILSHAGYFGNNTTLKE
jgi:hypothetical protein